MENWRFLFEQMPEEDPDTYCLIDRPWEALRPGRQELVGRFKAPEIVEKLSKALEAFKADIKANGRPRGTE